MRIGQLKLLMKWWWSVVQEKQIIQYPKGNTRIEYTTPSSVTSIGSSAFRECTSLTSAKIDYGNQYYSNDEVGELFKKDTTTMMKYLTGNRRTEYTIPDIVTTIDYETFSSCTSLTSITIDSDIPNYWNNENGI